jgi:menaquinone-dependent protoporphyrinogen oxidase
MRTIIVFSSKLGTTEKCAHKVASLVGGEVKIVNLKHASKIDISDYDNVIIGSGFYAGSIPGSVTAFIENCQPALLQRNFGVFMCCLAEGEEAQAQLESAFPEDILQKAKAAVAFGGEANYEKMNFLFRFILKKATKRKESFSTLDESKIEEFAKAFRS